VIALSSNHFSVDDQINDVATYLRSQQPDDYARLVAAFPDYEALTWSGSWVDTEASGVDSDHMQWVAEWIESNTPVFWEEGEPWLPEELDARGERA